MIVLVLGDIVGRPGRVVVQRELPRLRQALCAGLAVVNGENASGGMGLAVKDARDLLAAGADAITSGNHIWRHREIYEYLDAEPRVLRPANYPPGGTGSGLAILQAPGGVRVAILNLIGRTFMDPVDCPFQAADRLLEGIPADVRVRIVDFHAEATSEKKALAYHLKGRVSAVLGTHTHVQTSDAQILPGGTAYVTDLGMCGVAGSVLGMEPAAIIDRFLHRLPVRFELAEGKGEIQGAVLEVDEATGRAVSIRTIQSPAAQDEGGGADGQAS